MRAICLWLHRPAVALHSTSSKAMSFPLPRAPRRVGGCIEERSVNIPGLKGVLGAHNMHEVDLKLVSVG